MFCHKCGEDVSHPDTKVVSIRMVNKIALDDGGKYRATIATVQENEGKPLVHREYIVFCWSCAQHVAYQVQACKDNPCAWTKWTI